MKSVQLKFADGKPTGVWYCGKCREIYHNATSGGKPCSEHHREQAEDCCTGKSDWVPARWLLGGKCTGCQRRFDACICDRAAKHRCVSCNAKLFQQEGKQVRWGTEIREVCYECSNKIPATMLVDAAK